jgi:hypothetical protein
MKDLYYLTSDKGLSKLIDDLIDCGRESFSSLRDTDKKELTAHCIRILGDDAYVCIINSEKFSDTLVSFKRFLTSCMHDEAIEMAEIMSQNAIKYFEEDLNSIFEERISYNNMMKGFETRHYVGYTREWRKVS